MPSHHSPSPDATTFARAAAEHQQGRLAEAALLYENVLAREPDHVDALRLLGILRFQRGDQADGERLLRRAVAAAPDHAKAHDNLAFVLHATKRSDEALTLLRRAADLAPDNDAVLANLGSLLAEMGRGREAVAVLGRAIAANPGHASAHQHLGSELLKLGDARAALRHFAACRELRATNSAVLAHEAVALAETGDRERSRALFDFDRLVVCRDIGDRHGWPSLRDFNAALARYVSGNSTLHAEGTTVNGLDTGELLSAPEPCVAALKRWIDERIEERLASLPQAAHPLAANAPQSWRTESWGVRMWRQGYQVTHIHQKAWLSGVYYVQLPDVVHRGQDGHEGWIEFGRGPAELYHSSIPETRLIQPVEGMVITFPSYLWHRTIPFESDRDRISIAFDVIATG